MGPITTVLGTAGYIADRGEEEDSLPVSYTLGMLTSAIQAIPLQTMIDLVRSVDRDDIGGVQRALAFIAQPLSAAGAIGRATDDIVRDPEGFDEQFQNAFGLGAGIPGDTPALLPRIGVAGKPLEREGSFAERILSPSPRSTVKTGPDAQVAQELLDLDIGVGLLRGKEDEFSRQEELAFQRASNSALFDELFQVINDPRYDSQTAEGKKRIVQGIVGKFRNDTRDKANRLNTLEGESDFTAEDLVPDPRILERIR